MDIDIELLDLIWAYYLWTGTAQKLTPFPLLIFRIQKKLMGLSVTQYRFSNLIMLNNR